MMTPAAFAASYRDRVERLLPSIKLDHSNSRTDEPDSTVESLDEGLPALVRHLRAGSDRYRRRAGTIASPRSGCRARSR